VDAKQAGCPITVKATRKDGKRHCEIDIEFNLGSIWLKALMRERIAKAIRQTLLEGLAIICTATREILIHITIDLERVGIKLNDTTKTPATIIPTNSPPSEVTGQNLARL
jgi:hypothetical protein